MKKIIFTLLVFISQINLLFADKGILDGVSTEEKIRKGDIHIGDIPQIIKAAIDYLMYFAGTIAVIFIIIGAYQILFGSISNDKTKGKDTIIMALGGFAIASLAWIIIKLILDNFA